MGFSPSANTIILISELFIMNDVLNNITMCLRWWHHFMPLSWSSNVVSDLHPSFVLSLSIEIIINTGITLVISTSQPSRTQETLSHLDVAFGWFKNANFKSGILNESLNQQLGEVSNLDSHLELPSLNSHFNLNFHHIKMRKHLLWEYSGSLQTSA